MAGVKVTLSGVVQRMEYTAADFGEGEKIGPFGVPGEGEIIAVAQLAQDGDIVAQGPVRWMLEPRYEWHLKLERSPASIGCFTFGCYREVSFPIREDARHYDGEELRLVVIRFHPDECGDTC